LFCLLRYHRGAWGPLCKYMAVALRLSSVVKSFDNTRSHTHGQQLAEKRARIDATQTAVAVCMRLHRPCCKVTPKTNTTIVMVRFVVVPHISHRAEKNVRRCFLTDRRESPGRTRRCLGPPRRGAGRRSAIAAPHFRVMKFLRGSFVRRYHAIG
jgi:hypothetical protein